MGKSILVILLFLSLCLIVHENKFYKDNESSVCTFLYPFKTKENIKLVLLASDKIFPNNPILVKLAVAQAILESNLLGKPSQLARFHNNVFGITGSGTNGSVMLWTKEYGRRGWYTTKRPFANNKCLEDSFSRYQEMIETMPRYSNLKHVHNFKIAARLVQQDGWATDPSYARQLIEIYNIYLK